jgi:hypothetical protein
MFITVTKIETENCLREILKKEGYSLNNKKGLARLGPDIKAVRDKEDWYIEVTGSEKSGRRRVEDFYHAFFRSISRLNNKECKHIVIAVPEILRKILPIRARVYKIAWKRIAEAFPELEIWLVDTANKKYQTTSWSYWLKQGE